MNPLTVAILRSGLVDKKVLQQLERWGHALPPVTPVELPAGEDGAVVLSQMLEDALGGEDLVAVRTQDLDAIERYLATVRPGTLHLELGEVPTEIPVMFGRTVAGDFLLPWRGETLSEEMVKPTTRLTWLDEGGEHVERFALCDELYVGLVKVFMVCSPRR